MGGYRHNCMELDGVGATPTGSGNAVTPLIYKHGIPPGFFMLTHLRQQGNPVGFFGMLSHLRTDSILSEFFLMLTHLETNLESIHDS